MTADPIRHECRSTYAAFHHSGDRRPASIRYIVLHSTEGPTAQSAAEYFEQPSSGGSANLVVDDETCYRTLLDHVIPWGAPPLNTLGFHIEQAGYARWTRQQWLEHEQTIKRAAYKAALRCKWYRIPARVISDPHELQRDFGFPVNAGGIPQHPGPLRGGIVTHKTIGVAFADYLREVHVDAHHDPGDNYPIDVFLHHLDGFLTAGDL